MRKIGHKIAKPFFLHFLHKPDYPHFVGFSRPFHGVFTGFSWLFHVFFTVSGVHVTIFANLEVAPSIFQALDIFGGGTLLG